MQVPVVETAPSYAIISLIWMHAEHCFRFGQVHLHYRKNLNDLVCLLSIPDIRKLIAIY